MTQIQQIEEIAALQVRKAEIDDGGDSITDDQRIERYYTHIKIKRLAIQLDFAALAEDLRRLKQAERASKELSKAVLTAGEPK